MRTSLRKKRKKSSRMHGSGGHGRGFKKKGRGSGHKGGKGMAGSGKRADQKKTMILNLKEKYFGGPSLNAHPKKYKIINLKDIERFAEIANGKEIDLKSYKILSGGNIKNPLTIHAFSASKKALEKVEKIGGKIIIYNGRPKEFNEKPSRN